MCIFFILNSSLLYTIIYNLLTTLIRFIYKNTIVLVLLFNLKSFVVKLIYRNHLIFDTHVSLGFEINYSNVIIIKRIRFW